MGNATQENSEQLVRPDAGRYNSENLMWPADRECNSGEIRKALVARQWKM